MRLGVSGLVGIGIGLVVGSAVALGLLLTSDHVEFDVSAALAFVVAWSFAFSGTVAWWRRPDNRTGPLMVAFGFSLLATALAASNASIPYTTGLTIAILPFAIFFHLLLVYPTGRFENRLHAGLAIWAYAVVLLLHLAELLFFDPLEDDCTACPENALQVEQDSRAVDAIISLEIAMGVAALLALAVILARRWYRASAASRRILWPVLLTGGATVVLLAALLVLDRVSESAAEICEPAIFVALTLVAAAFLWGIVRSRLAQAAVADLLVDLGTAPHTGGLRASLVRALGDPSLAIAYWRAEPGGFVDLNGRPVSLPEEGTNRATTPVERDGTRVAALIHDATLLDEPELLGAVSAAASLALVNEQLQADLRARIEELRTSEQHVRALLDAIPDLMFRFDQEGTYLDYKAEEPSDLAAPPDELLGQTLHDVLPARIADEFTVRLARVLDAGEMEILEYRLDLKEQSKDFEARLVRSGDTEVLAIVRDITERKRAEAELRRLHEELESHIREVKASRTRIVEAGDSERRRLERNLHDGAQQRLVALSLALRMAQKSIRSDPNTAENLIAGATSELGHAIDELRELARGIHPAVLADRGLVPALESVTTRAPVPVDLICTDDHRLPSAVEAAAFYIVAEAITNVAKYAEASAVSVSVSRDNGLARVEVRDDGIGGADPAAGTGLRGLADRVEALDGAFEVTSPPGDGTIIRAEIPIPLSPR